MHRRRTLTLLLCLLASPAIFAADKTPKPAAADATLIIPGKSIGAIALGADSEKLPRQLKLGEPDYSEGVMGGKGFDAWYLPSKHGDKGHPFHRPDEIGIASLRDMDATNPPALITEVYVTSPRYATADGIAPGSTLDAIRAKYPGIKDETPDGDTSFFPLHGAMQFFLDAKSGIGFEIRKRDGLCVQVMVIPPEASALGKFHTWGYSLASADYVIDDVDGKVGNDIQLGMTGAKLLALLGKPDEKRDDGSGELWRWRVPPQRPAELPGLCISLRKLPDGSLIADQIRLSSPAFMIDYAVYPGCALKDAMQATGNVAKIATYADQHLDIYGDWFAGLLFDVRQADSICTAITILPPPLDIHKNMGGHWLNLPPNQPVTGD